MRTLEEIAANKHKHDILALDVWGNAKDGWEINEARTTGITVDLTNDMTDAQIIKAVRKACGHRADARGYELDHTCESVEFSGVYINRKSDGKPAYHTRVAYVETPK